MQFREEIMRYAGELEKLCVKNDSIAPEFYEQYDVKRGLRDINGKGVLTGLTNISRIDSSKIINGEKVSCDGKLWYRGYDIFDLVKMFAG
ncbi:MAG: citrate synthase, partial [Lachnospiraceae bacterium]|nr:citrate synthase [Lachnospiraceae bacterium]